MNNFSRSRRALGRRPNIFRELQNNEISRGKRKNLSLHPKASAVRFFHLASIASSADKYVFLGFSRIGKYVISYSLAIDVPDVGDFGLPSHDYKLQWWLFDLHRPLKLVKEVRLFGDESIEETLLIFYCEPPLPSTAAVVYGKSFSANGPECYITIASQPDASQDCAECLDSSSSCLTHGSVVDLRFCLTTQADAARCFCPRDSIAIPHTYVFNAADSVTVLRVSAAEAPSPHLLPDCRLCQKGYRGFASDPVKHRVKLFQAERVGESPQVDFYDFCFSVTAAGPGGQQLHEVDPEHATGRCVVVHQMTVDVERFITWVCEGDPAISQTNWYLGGYDTALLKACPETVCCVLAVSASLKGLDSSNRNFTRRLKIVFTLSFLTGETEILSLTSREVDGHQGSRSTAKHSALGDPGLRSSCKDEGTTSCLADLVREKKQLEVKTRIPLAPTQTSWVLNNLPTLKGISLKRLRDSTGLLNIVL